jgi:hypothetical protein
MHRGVDRRISCGDGDLAARAAHPFGATARELAPLAPKATHDSHGVSEIDEG